MLSVSVFLFKLSDKQRACAVIMLSSVARLALSCSLKLSLKRNDFSGKVVQRKICVLIFSITLTEIFLILRRIQRDIIVKAQSIRIKYPSFLSPFKQNIIFSTDFRKILKYEL
jgi:hypothetical protein